MSSNFLFFSLSVWISFLSVLFWFPSLCLFMLPLQWFSQYLSFSLFVESKSFSSIFNFQEFFLIPQSSPSPFFLKSIILSYSVEGNSPLIFPKDINNKFLKFTSGPIHNSFFLEIHFLVVYVCALVPIFQFWGFSWMFDDPWLIIYILEWDTKVLVFKLHICWLGSTSGPHHRLRRWIWLLPWGAPNYWQTWVFVAVSRYFLADKLVTHITIEQFLPQKKCVCRSRSNSYN